MGHFISNISVFLIMLFLFTNNISAQSPVPIIPSEDDRIYPGLYWGAAGITKGLLELRSMPYINASSENTFAPSKLDEIIIKSLNGIWDSRMQNFNNQTISSWQKVAGADIYPSKKYGAAGIVDIFIEAYLIYNNYTYLQWAESAINEIYAQVQHFSLPHWPYAYPFSRSATGIYITDVSFGSLGIIDSTLNLYMVNKNTTYLNYAINATQWLYNISYDTDIDGETNKIIPWYQNDENYAITYTSYTQGNSGAIPILIKLANASNDVKWANWATFIAKWILNLQNTDGSWVHNPHSTVLTKYTNFELGIVGIMEGLIHLISDENKPFNLTDDLKYQIIDGVQKGTNWLVSSFISNDTHNIFPIDDLSQYAKYSLYEGMSGITKYLRMIDNHSINISSSKISSVYLASFDWLKNNAIYYYEEDGVNLMGFYSSTFNEKYSDLSYAYGLVGCALELLFIAVYEFGENYQNYLDTNFISNIVNTVEYYQLENGLWNRQNYPNSSIEFPPQIFALSALLISFIGLIVYQYKIKKPN